MVLTCSEVLFEFLHFFGYGIYFLLLQICKDTHDNLQFLTKKLKLPCQAFVASASGISMSLSFYKPPNDGSWPPLVQGMVSFSSTFPPKASTQRMVSRGPFIWAALDFVLHQSSKAEKGSTHFLSHLFRIANILSQCQAISGFLSFI